MTRCQTELPMNIFIYVASLLNIFKKQSRISLTRI
jgi:hypothetical protein